MRLRQHSIRSNGRSSVRFAAVAAGVITVGGLFSPLAASAAPAGLGVSQVNLVSDQSTVGAAVVDPDLINPWGLALGPATPLWSANTGTDTATLYASPAHTTTAVKVGAVRVTFPDQPELPTGQVFNPTTSFEVANATKHEPARFIFSTLTGRIEAWSPLIDPLQGNAETKATVPGASYTGLALASSASGPKLYAADFGQGRIDVFDARYQLQQPVKGAFTDPRLPAGYSPFNVTTLNGILFVAYAAVDPRTHRNAVGAGLGVVDEYTPDGRLLSRVVRHDTLNAPWGLAIAPPSWGSLAGDLLVGNFGDGRISVIRLTSDGRFHGGDAGVLRNSATGAPLVIDGLWSLVRGTATTGGDNSIWFSAGTDHETHGLVGVLRRP